MTAKQASRRRSHRLLMWVGGAALVTLAAVAGGLLMLAHRAEPMLRALIVQELSDHFHARVELDSFHLELRDGLRAQGQGLRIWPASSGAALQGAANGAPLIRLAEFRFHAPLRYKPGEAIRVSVIQLKGLEIDVPPRVHADQQNTDKRHAGKQAEQKLLPMDTGGKTGAQTGLLRFEVAGVECNGAHLTIETSKPGKLPLEFTIAHLRLSGIKAGGSMGFEAELTNPKPVGTIHSSGNFGPWVVEDPGESPLTGDYKFEHADLGGFKGIAGILSSVGHYGGTLRELTVDGETDTPDFRLTHFGTALALHTNFHARVDGTNGDTWLEPVEATLGGSHFWARGKVVRVPDVAGAGGGHDIAMKVDVDRGRIEDFLRLASSSGTAVMTGSMVTKSEFDISPGVAPVEERLKLTGTFALDDVQFESEKVRGRIAELSARGQGRPKDAKNGSQADVRSTMDGTFKMGAGVVTLSTLEYAVPGAVIDLTGKYGVDGGTVDFAGTAKMDAKVSQMVGGWKGLLLKPVDRYFQKNGAGTEVPIHINGTRENLQFGVDVKGMKGLKRTSPQRPDEITHPEQPGAAQDQPQ